MYGDDYLQSCDICGSTRENSRNDTIPEMENAQTPALVRPIRKVCWFVNDSTFDNYDTYASVQALRKSCEAGDMLSEAEIVALQANQDINMDGVNRPSRRWVRRQRQKK